MATPPTLIDPPVTHPAHAPSRRTRKGGGLFFGVLVVLLVLVGGAAAGYWHYFHYQPVAARHVPAGSSMALRVDFEEIALFAPVRRHLWPLVFDKPETTATEPTIASRIEAATGLNLGQHVREIIVVNHGRTDSGKWLVIVGGKIRRGMVEALAKLAEEEKAGWELAPSKDALVSPKLGFALGQAADRTLILASDLPTLALALPEQDGAKAIGLPETGAFGFAIGASAWGEWGSGLTARLVPGLGSLAQLQGCNGRFVLGSNPQLEMQCRLASGVDAEKVRSSLLGITTTVQGLSLLVGGKDIMGERRALADLQIENLGDGRLRMTAPWPIEGLDRGAEMLATKVRGLRLVAN